MRNAPNCLICAGKDVREYQGLFAPFIANRIWSRDPFPVGILNCASCDFSFAESRFEPDEETRLYRDYRGSEYQALRESCEPWYTKDFNARLSTGTMEKRRAPLSEIFKQHITADIKAILDFGGDRGDLFDGLIPGSTTYVYDISGVQAAPGVRSLRTLQDCGALEFDLIGCSNVLEHVAAPRDLMADIRAISKPNTLVFVEVPSETPFGLLNYAKRSAQEAILMVRRPRLAFSMLPLRFLRQVHEHVNFFSLQSLSKLMEYSGFTVLAQGLYQSEGFSFGPYKIAAGNMAWALGRMSAGITRESI